LNIASVIDGAILTIVIILISNKGISTATTFF